jgi:RNA polymerase subunit RPABC4/transcription elongation factor Spt4
MTNEQVTYRICGHCKRRYDSEELYDLYAAVSLAINTEAVLVDTPGEVEFCPQCGQDFTET